MKTGSFKEFINVKDVKSLFANNVGKTNKKLLIRMEYGQGRPIESVHYASKILLKYTIQFWKYLFIKIRMIFNGIGIPECPKNGFKKCNLRIIKIKISLKKERFWIQSLSKTFLSAFKKSRGSCWNNW